MARYITTKNKKGEKRTVIQRSVYSPIYPSDFVPTGSPGRQRPLVDPANLRALANPYPVWTKEGGEFARTCADFIVARARAPKPPAFLGKVSWNHA